MAEIHPARLMIHPREQAPFTASQGRRFAFTVAGAFVILGAFTLWRGRYTVAGVFATIAAVLLLGGLLIPARLRPVERVWMRFATILSRVTTPVFMGIVYFLVLTPAGVIRRTVGRDPLKHGIDNGGYWVRRPARDSEAKRRRMERQF